MDFDEQCGSNGVTYGMSDILEVLYKKLNVMVKLRVKKMSRLLAQTYLKTLIDYKFDHNFQPLWCAIKLRKFFRWPVSRKVKKCVTHERPRNGLS